jgi:hypothetical protein
MPIPEKRTADHFHRLAQLLELESKAEARRALEDVQRLSAAEAERTGNSLIGLVVKEEYSGLGGRIILTLTKRNASAPLPWTRLQVGSPVLLSTTGGSLDGWRGVLSERGEHFVRVAVNDTREDVDEDAVYRVDLRHVLANPSPTMPT